MTKEILNYALIFVVMLLIQVLICNHIVLFQVAMPIIFIYFIIRLPVGMNTSMVLTLAFLIGLGVDIFSDTLGVNSLACTLIAALKKPLLYLYVPKDDRTKDIIPSISNLGISVYSKYMITFVTIYCFMAFSIEYFSFAAVKEITVISLSSALLSFAILLGIDSLVVAR